MKDGPFYVYVLSHPEGEGFYVGQTKSPEQRWQQHRPAVKHGGFGYPKGLRTADLKMTVVTEFKSRFAACRFERCLMLTAHACGIHIVNREVMALRDADATASALGYVRQIVKAK